MAASKSKRHHSFFYRNGLTIVFFIFFIVFLIAQAVSGWYEHNDFLKDKGQATINLTAYLQSGHFIQATFENWESEFLQMALFVILSIFLRQKGSSESKKLDEEEEVDREPKASWDAPWPVRKGGIYLVLYKHSLSIVLSILFILTFLAHFYGSWMDYNEQQLLEHKSTVILRSYMTKPKFWFESFQNWQSEFLSVASIVFLSIYLRQKGSPQSKPVDAPHSATEK
jgi:hypothetical protein